MPNRQSTSGSELFIVDNSDTDWKVLRYLHDWCQIARGIDIATGYFEIGALLGLKGEWQKVDEIRILMGDEVSLRTRDAFTRGLGEILTTLDDSIEREKRQNDFLEGVDAIADAIRTGKIKCRVYRREKFHAKAYITHARLEVVGSAALVGSSNLTYPGLTENIELNVQITGRPVTVLQEWYEEHWNAAEDVTPQILRTIERHVREFSPFEVFARSLQQYFRGFEQTATEWETGSAGERRSRVYPLLDQYQKDGYHQLQKIAARWRGAFLCDGVGLGKTFVGLMLIEWLAEFSRKRVALFVPKAARETVWEPALRKYLPHVAGDFTSLVVYNHTDLTRGGDFAGRFQQLRDRADAIVIDEAHHFRNPGTLGAAPIDVPDPSKPAPGYIPGEGRVRPSRYRRLFEIADGKEIYLMTATPVNNRLIDLQHMIELFSRRQADYFKDAPLGIHSLAGHFRKMEKDLERLVTQRQRPTSPEDKTAQADAEDGETNLIEAEKVLNGDSLFKALVVQRSRTYVRKSQEKNGGSKALFPTRQSPCVAAYQLKKTYGKLLEMLEKAFHKQKPLFSLALYYPLAFFKGSKEDIKPFELGRQRQIVGLIRTSFLKRFESSAVAFGKSCESLLLKILAWVEVHGETDREKHRFEKWKAMHEDLIGPVERQRSLFEQREEEDEEDLDFVPQEMLDAVQRLDRARYNIEDMLDECYSDLDQLSLFLMELQKFEPKHDDKLKTLLNLLKTDPVLKDQKVLIFTEFMDTARYLEDRLAAAGTKGVAEIDSARASAAARTDLICRFSPYYNGSSSDGLARRSEPEIRVLISTDVLSEGLNLQDATRLINYDLHWNPVRLMQRIGRVDRRLSPEVEQRILADHPQQKPIRGTVAYWNFLPPDELNQLLSLWSRVTHKVLRISKTFGIEGRQLLTDKDDYDALREFNEAYEGTESPIEKMHLEWQELQRQHPDLPDRLNALPSRVFSGKAHPSTGAQAVFFCFALPGRPRTDLTGGDGALAWTEEAGKTEWYLYDLATGQIANDAATIIDLVRSRPETPRRTNLPRATLAEIRAKIEKRIKDTYLKAAQAPVGVRPVLKAWMELN